jgi:DNA ligase (NAD+)
VAHRCKVAGSFEQQLRKLIHFAGKHALDIDGMGRETVKALMEHNLVADLDDLFDLTKDELLALEGFEELKASNLLAGIREAKKVPLDRLLVGLSIPHVGEETAHLIATRFGTLTKLAEATVETLSAIEGVGPIIAETVAGWFADVRNTVLLARLRKHLTVTRVVAPASGTLSGQTVVVTGTLPTLSRDEAEALVRKAGGKVASSVSAKTSFVVAGEAAGSKITKAEEFGVQIIDERAFLERVR